MRLCLPDLGRGRNEMVFVGRGKEVEQPASRSACPPNRRDAWLPHSHRTLHKINAGTLPNSFYEDSITLIQSQTKRHKNTKLQANVPHTHRPEDFHPDSSTANLTAR